ncbi:MAG: flagellar protein FlgN [Gammaproteobacteria bacterium]|nr:flagellar protein FlgN [Gammaproteobacteria bacterium]
MFSYPEPEALSKILAEQFTQLNGMLAILKKEERALKDRDIETFEDAVQQKQRQVQRLEKLEKYIVSFSGNSAAAKMDAYVFDLPASDIKNKITVQWENFQSLVRQCDQQNKVNNKVMLASRVSLQQAMDILRGEASTPNLYEASGKSKDAGRQQTIGVA